MRAYTLDVVPTYSLPAPEGPSSSGLTAQYKGKRCTMEGMIYIFDIPIHVLFDTGASLTFLSSSLIDNLHIISDLVHEPLVVLNPMGSSANLSMICRGIRFAINGFEFSLNAYILGFSSYHLIIGIDWMSRHGVVLDCERMVV